MEIEGNYERYGYLHIRELIPVEITRSFMRIIRDGLGPGPIKLGVSAQPGGVLCRPALEIHGRDYPPMDLFLWALTPIVAELTGKAVLPTYAFFRIYREGDICRVHSDRPACEHSISLTLDYRDGAPWDLEVARERTPRGQAVTEDFGIDGFSSIYPRVGDGVLYRGVDHRHGRTKPNPNAWSAHLFLHFVEREGRFAEHQFDARPASGAVNFHFCK